MDAWPDLERRTTLTSEHGALACDSVWTQVRCAAHGLTASGPASVDLDGGAGVEALGHALRAYAARGGRCAGCGGPAEVEGVRLHTFVRERGRDLALLWSAQAPDRVELRWWSGADGEQAAELGPEVDAWLVRDRALRLVASCLELAQQRRAHEVAARVVEARPGDPALVDLLPLVLRLGPDGWPLGRAIVEADARPDAARVAAQALIEATRRGEAGDDALREALELLDRLGAHTSTGDELLRAALLRALGAADAAWDAYADIAARDPTSAGAHAALGELAKDPLAALAHFMRASAADPALVDGPLGEARALLRLGRRDDATAAVARARALDPQHPRLGRLEFELRRRTDPRRGAGAALGGIGGPVVGPRATIEVVGIDAWGEPVLEREVVALATSSDLPEDAARDLGCDLGLVEGSILTRDHAGTPLRLYQVQGDGRCVSMTPLDDDEAVAVFTEEFAAMWAEERGAS